MCIRDRCRAASPSATWLRPVFRSTTRTRTVPSSSVTSSSRSTTPRSTTRPTSTLNGCSTATTSEGWVGAVQHRRADAMVHHLAAYLRTASEVVAVEQPFSVEVGRVVLRGVVDRLERVTDDDGTVRVRVVDLKTGRLS